MFSALFRLYLLYWIYLNESVLLPEPAQDRNCECNMIVKNQELESNKLRKQDGSGTWTCHQLHRRLYTCRRLLASLEHLLLQKHLHCLLSTFWYGWPTSGRMHHRMPGWPKQAFSSVTTTFLCICWYSKLIKQKREKRGTRKHTRKGGKLCEIWQLLVRFQINIYICGRISEYLWTDYLCVLFFVVPTSRVLSGSHPRPFC